MQQITDVPKLSPRPLTGHKGDFGKICMIAGSVGFSGAAAIAGTSALRAGAGLVRVATPTSILPIVAAIQPCFTTIALAESEGKISKKAVDVVLKAAEENDVLAFGPGVGIGPGPKVVLENLLKIENLRLIIDADGLNNLAKLPDWPSFCKADLILTPHPGEMKRIWTGLLREPLPKDRKTQALEFATATSATVVLKGYETIVADCEKFYINTTGNPGMATAGAGDALTGVISALCGQGLSNFDAAVLGVYVHGLAGDLAAESSGQISLIATDIMDYLSKAFKNLI